MKPAPISLPQHLAPRISTDVAAHLAGIGNTTLLAEPLLGFIASRQCPGHMLIETLERVPEWARNNRVLVSGFHSPLEQQVLRSLLRRQGRAVKVLARCFNNKTGYLPNAEEYEPLAQSRLLILSAFPPNVTRITRETSLGRNQLVLQLATEVCVPHISPNSPLAGRQGISE